MPQVAQGLPETYRKLVVKKLSNNFREATEIRTAKLAETLQSLQPQEVLVRYHYWGINASEINFTDGFYTPNLQPPFDAGLEGLGVVMAVGDAVQKFRLGDKVTVAAYHAFSEFHKVKESLLFPIPDLRPEYLNIVNGLTAYLSLHDAAKVKPGEVVLVTAASGGTGQIAVQVAKKLGATVLGTCGSEEKVQYLKVCHLLYISIGSCTTLCR